MTPNETTSTSHWRELKRGYRWERSDGAVVMWDQRSPHPNPLNLRSRMWTAWEPDPSSLYLAMSRGRFRKTHDGGRCKPGFPRRWKTAKAAMQAVDREYPLPSIQNRGTL
jgi:hypothetical protein